MLAIRSIAKYHKVIIVIFQNSTLNNLLDEPALTNIDVMDKTVAENYFMKKVDNLSFKLIRNCYHFHRTGTSDFIGDTELPELKKNDILICINLHLKNVVMLYFALLVTKIFYILMFEPHIVETDLKSKMEELFRYRFL